MRVGTGYAPVRRRSWPPSAIHLPIGSLSSGRLPIPLSAIAPLLRVRQVEVQDLCRFASAWRSAHTAEAPSWAQFHMVTKGNCFLDLDNGETFNLQAGSLLLLPRVTLISCGRSMKDAAGRCPSALSHRPIGVLGAHQARKATSPSSSPRCLRRLQEVQKNMPTRIATMQPHCSSTIRSRSTSAAKASVTSG
jgi:hypothetical protein